MTDPTAPGVVVTHEPREVPAVTANLGRMALALLLFASVMVCGSGAPDAAVRSRPNQRDRAAAETPPATGRHIPDVKRMRSTSIGEAAVGWGPTRYVPFIEWTRAPYCRGW